MLATKNNTFQLAATGGRIAQWLGSAALDLLFPPICMSCYAELESARRAPFCDDCLRQVTFLHGVTCLKCSAPVPGDSPRKSCPRCVGTKLWFDDAVALGEYEDRLRDWLLRMKDDSGEALALAVAELLWQQHGERLRAADADVVVPVPMHWRRRLERGTNSPTILAERLADHLQAPLANDLLRRTRHTKPQFSVPPSQRRANVRNAFVVRSGYHLEGATVLLVDDILTTGSTCSAAARALKQAGAARVAVAAVARTLSH